MNYSSIPTPQDTHRPYVDNKPVPYESEIHEDGTQNARISGKWLEIAFCFFVMTIPMLAFSAILLGLVFHYRIQDNDIISANLQFAKEQLSSDAVYVNLSPTLLTTIASWSSTVAPILVGFAITLLTFPIAKGLMSASMHNEQDRLPTPYQLALMIRMNSASAANSLYHWLRYIVLFRKGRSKQPAGLTWMTVILVVSWLLSVLVFATDTWLHVATKAVNLVQVAPSSNTANLTFALMPGCTTTNNSITAVFDADVGTAMCILNPAASTTFLMGSSSALAVVNNISTTMAVKSVVSSGSTFSYMGNANQQRLTNLDYTANTFAITTECSPVTTQCMDADKFYGASTPFKCPFAFEGDLAKNPWSTAFFTDSSMKDNATFDGVNNPYHFALATSQNQALGRVNLALETDPEIMISTHGATVFALTCSSTVYDVEYSSVNGTITRWIMNKSNSSVATILQSEEAQIGIGSTYMQQATSLSMFSNTSTEVADLVAQAYSRVAMSLVAGAFQSTPGSEAQARTSIIAARVPYAPLGALLAANLLLVALGVVLTVLAIATARGTAGEAQARLSIQAIVAQCFEGATARRAVSDTDAMYDEYQGRDSKKVAVVTTREGGWAFGTLRPSYEN